MKRAVPVHSCCIITTECTSTGTPFYLDQKKRRKDLVAITRKCLRNRSWVLLHVPFAGHVCTTQKAAASGDFTCSSASARPRPRRRPFFSEDSGALVILGAGDWGWRRRKYEDMTSGGGIKEGVALEPANENGRYPDHDRPLDLLSRSTKLTLGLFSKVTKGRPPEEAAAAGDIVELMQAQEPPTSTTALGEDVVDDIEREAHEQPHFLHRRRSRSRSGVVAVAGESDLTSAENHNDGGRAEELDESSRSSNNNTDGSSILLESAAESVDVSRSSISNTSELQSAVPGFQQRLHMHGQPPPSLLLQHATAHTTANGVGAGGAGEGGDLTVGWSTKHQMNDGFPPINDTSNNQGIMSMRVDPEDMNNTGSEGLAGLGSGSLLGGRGGSGSSNELAFRSLAAHVHDRELPFLMQSASAAVPSDQLRPRVSNANSQESWLQLGVGPSVDSSSSAAHAPVTSLSFHPSSSHHNVAPSNGDPHDHDRPWSGQQQLQGHDHAHAHAHERNFSWQLQQRPSTSSSTSMAISFPIAGAAEQWHHRHRNDSSSIIPSEYGRSTTSSDTGVRSGPSMTNFSPATLRRVPIADADAAAPSISTRDQHEGGASGSSTVHFPAYSTNVPLGQSTLFVGGGGISMNAVGTGPGGAADAHGQQAFGHGIRSNSGGSASVIRTSSMRNDLGISKDATRASSSLQRDLDAVDEERFYDTRSQIPAVFPPARFAEFPNDSGSSLGRYVSYSNPDNGPAAVHSTIISSATGTGGGGVHGHFSRVEHGYGSSSSATVGRSTDVNNNNLQFRADGQPFSLASFVQTRDGDLRGGTFTTGSGIASGGYPWHPPHAFEAGGVVPSSRLIPVGKNFQGWTSNATTSVPISNANSTFNAQSQVRADDGPVSVAINSNSQQQAIRASDESSWGSYFRKVSPSSMVFQSSSTAVTGHDREPHAQLHPPPGEDTAFQSMSYNRHRHNLDERSLAALPVPREGTDGDRENLGVLKRAIKHIQGMPAWPPAETLNLGPVAWQSSSSANGNGLRGDFKLENSFDASSSEPPLNISPFLSEPSFTARGDRVSLRATPHRRQTWQQQEQQQAQKHTPRPHYSSSSANAPHKQQTPLTLEKAKLRLLPSGESDSRGSYHAPGLWFILQSAETQSEEGGLPQISKAYLRIKDGKMPVSAVKKYLVSKLGLTSESEVEITCKGQPVVPSLPLQHVRDVIWFSNLAANGKAAAGQNLASSHSSGDHDHDYDQDRDEEFRATTMLPAGAPDHDSAERSHSHQPGSMLSADGAESASASAAAAVAATATIMSNDILMVLTYRRHSRDRTLPLTTFLT